MFYILGSEAKCLQMFVLYFLYWINPRKNVCNSPQLNTLYTQKRIHMQVNLDQQGEKKEVKLWIQRYLHDTSGVVSIPFLFGMSIVMVTFAADTVLI